ncbi:MAG: hypothetical protein A3C85_02120 [Candidatus Doudnabacteria bacterium RIFCSPHIGHO2_02_FULL_48_21]|nr:MAG: hypothetical protein A3K05_02410 [Candidatus Doudnabacteria bacterium RIFCSPHIGHO2_01_48_18]OGE93423.1 MAG: hypothetical protein A3C85_02120 [Candidatus Doudnabacteria bacterium RIFCSPHIGHO2_02_FULL_48_21]OGE97828.1 MAG: hypothetical protein A3A83_03680 [Candidatus Doudnabacteria bacterium RIFCSPLOWO2_01_FULL_48_57]OGF02149.1 MAG: hypothetical protein A3G07_00850 [Candidatus Doudnabacteria bacterium RIFCSPLOWO2_12_FULL_47_12]
MLDSVRNLARTNALKALGRVISGGIDLIFPVFCQGCGREGWYLCLACQTLIEAPIHRCLVCGKNSPLGQIHSECQSKKIGLTGLMIAAEYRAPAVRNLIWHLKYNSVKDISKTLALLMADFLANNDLVDYFAQSIVVAVPIHASRFRFRGFNQSMEIASQLAKNLGMEMTALLSKTKNTTRQVELTRDARLENIKNTFAVDPRFDGEKLRGRKILLIDDVATTGATLNECALTLKQFAPAEIWGLVVARN